MKRLFVLAGVAATVILAAPAHADGADGDTEFLAALSGAGLSHRGPDRAIAAGKAVCQLMDSGLSPMDTVAAVQYTNTGFTTTDAAKFATISATTYCADHI